MVGAQRIAIRLHRIVIESNSEVQLYMDGEQVCDPQKQMCIFAATSKAERHPFSTLLMRINGEDEESTLDKLILCFRQLEYIGGVYTIMVPSKEEVKAFENQSEYDYLPLEKLREPFVASCPICGNESYGTSVYCKMHNGSPFEIKNAENQTSKTNLWVKLHRWTTKA